MAGGEEEFHVPMAKIAIANNEDVNDDDDVVESIITLEDEAGGKRQYRFHSDAVLGKGTFGTVYLSSNGWYVIKILDSFEANPRDTARLKKAFESEVMLQLRIREHVPEACPAIVDYGMLPGSNERFVVMEKMTASAHSYIIDPSHSRDDREMFAIECLRQVADILKKLEPYQFNHRDLKTDNIMYTAGEDGLPVFKLIDFGFACGTFYGTRYEGISYFSPGIHCFRRSRDLAFLVLELHLFKYKLLPQSFNVFLQLLLTFKFPDGSECKMYAGCPPGLGKWEDSYRFLDKDNVENPHTTPEGLLHAIEVYERRGIEACAAGFVMDPVGEVCVAAPPAGASKLASPAAVSPKPVVEHMLSLPAVTPGSLSLSPEGGRRRSRRRKTQKQKRTRRFKRTKKV